MPRFLPLVLLVVFPLSLSIAAPVPKAIKSRKVPLVEGTIWLSDESEVKLGTLEYTFQEGGKLAVKSSQNGQSHGNGTWRQEGDTLYWECNQKYVEYNATFKDGRFDGAALNVTGLRWSVSLGVKEK